jgi:hypothetical protein
MPFVLRFPESHIAKWAAEYAYPGEPELLAGPVAAARRRGHLLFDEFLQIAEWKSKRPRRYYRQNEPATVKEVTSIALDARTSPRLSVEILTLLSGVDWKTASVILHLCHTEPYPVLDFRTLWSLTCPEPKTFHHAFWSDYVDFTRALAKRTGHDMRTLDRALWQYSKLHQNGA